MASFCRNDHQRRLAGLGFGLSGVLIQRLRFVSWQRALHQPVGRLMLGLLVMIAVVAAGSVALYIPFTPVLIAWQPRQLGYLLLIYLVLLVPFTLGALVIGLALQQARDDNKGQPLGRVYAANLFGSGLGVLLGLVLGYLPLPLTINQFKGLSSTLTMAGARVMETAHHPLGRVDLVAAPALRLAPGLSLLYDGPMPSQQTIFVNGDGGSAMNLAAISDPSSEYLAWLPSAAGYAANTPSSVLVIGVGGGTELHQALYFRATQVTGVEMHPDVARIVSQQLSAVRDSKSTMPKVVVGDARAFLRRSSDRFDLIQISLMESLAATATGVGAANESYLDTVEALDDFLDHLSAQGILSITRWLKHPPRDCLRLVASVVTALENRGVTNVGAHLVFLRGWATGTLLVKSTAFTSEEIERVRRWAARCAFDVDYFPGVTEELVNQRNVMDQPEYYQSIRSILSPDRDRFLRHHLFDLRPTTDDRPYHFHSFRWRTLPHLIRTAGRDWLPFAEWGYLVLVATLVQAVTLSVVLLGVPAVWRFARPPSESDRSTPAVLVYFAVLGLGFMFLEIALLQKLSLLLGNPLIAASLVIGSFLVFAGVGAVQVGRRVHSVRWPILFIITWSLGIWLCLPWLGRVSLILPGSLRAVISVILVAPLAYCLGMPFALGLTRASATTLPRAWAVNGCFSVIGAVLASVLSMDFGFGTVIVAGAGCYLVAAITWGRLNPASDDRPSRPRAGTARPASNGP